MKINKLHEAIKDAEKGEGYLVMITKLQGDKLFHSPFISNFKKEDIMSSIDEHTKKLKSEVK